jgi:hypothetical protein
VAFVLPKTHKNEFLKIMKSLLNWIQIPTAIHFSFLFCHQGIFVPRMVIEIGSYLSPSNSWKIISLHPIPCQSSSLSLRSTPSAPATQVQLKK